MLDFLTICTNNSFFFKEISLNVNIKKTNSVEAYKMFMRSLVKLSFQSRIPS